MAWRAGMSWAAIVAGALLAGCASYDGRGLQPGVADAAEVERTMGRPQAVYKDDGGEWWAYPRGPRGDQTFMARIGKDGRLQSIEPVLTPAGFARVRIGMREEDVLRVLGPPTETSYFARRQERLWSYRFLDIFHVNALFHVVFDTGGAVTYTFESREPVPSGAGLQ